MKYQVYFQTSKTATKTLDEQRQRDGRLINIGENGETYTNFYRNGKRWWHFLGRFSDYICNYIEDAVRVPVRDRLIDYSSAFKSHYLTAMLAIQDNVMRRPTVRTQGSGRGLRD